MEKLRKERKRKEREERKQKARLDFDFPSESARREKRREEKRKEAGELSRAGGMGEHNEDGISGADTRMWESDGHLNFFTDIERNVSR